MGGSSNIYTLLKPYNPWWRMKRWYMRDPLIKTFEKSILKKEPRLYYHLRGIARPGVYGIVTVRGPRRSARPR